MWVIISSNLDRMSDMSEEPLKAPFTGSWYAGVWKVKVQVHVLGIEKSLQL